MLSVYLSLEQAVKDVRERKLTSGVNPTKLFSAFLLFSLFILE